LRQRYKLLLLVMDSSTLDKVLQVQCIYTYVVSDMVFHSYIIHT